MPGFDAATVSQRAMEAARLRFIKEIDLLLQSNTAVVRRGVAGLLEPKLTSAQRTQLRRSMEALALSDPDAYSVELRKMISQTSLSEVLKLFTDGRK